MPQSLFRPHSPLKKHHLKKTSASKKFHSEIIEISEKVKRMAHNYHSVKLQTKSIHLPLKKYRKLIKAKK